MHLYLDIKTIPSQRPGLREEIAATIQPPGNISKAETIAAWEAEKKPGLVDEAYAKTAFDGATGHLLSLAFAIEDGKTQHTGTGNARPGIDAGVTYPVYLGLEAQRLSDAFHYMTQELQDAANAAVKHPWGPGRGYVTRQPDGTLKDCEANIGPVTIVGHHADHVVRFLYQRAVILGVPVPRWFPVNARANSTGGFMGPAIFDTMTYWTGYGGRISLDRLCSTLGVMRWGDGSDVPVYERWLAGDTGDIGMLTCADVEGIRQIHRKLTFWTPPEPVAQPHPLGPLDV